MAKTYKELDGFPGITVPVLHNIVYGKCESALYERHPKQVEIDAWLSENCKDRYYHTSSWMRVHAIQFEDDEDALMFALKYGA